MERCILIESRDPFESNDVHGKNLHAFIEVLNIAAMQGAGPQHTVLLRGNAVNYAIAGQGAPALEAGA
jgi:hypothetical protein